MRRADAALDSLRLYAARHSPVYGPPGPASVLPAEPLRRGWARGDHETGFALADVEDVIFYGTGVQRCEAVRIALEHDIDVRAELLASVLDAGVDELTLRWAMRTYLRRPGLPAWTVDIHRLAVVELSAALRRQPDNPLWAAGLQAAEAALLAARDWGALRWVTLMRHLRAGSDGGPARDWLDSHAGADRRVIELFTRVGNAGGVTAAQVLDYCRDCVDDLP